MEKRKDHSMTIWGLVLWGLACFFSAFHISKFDMGFDGVKVYLVLCTLMLIITLSTVALLKRYKS